MACNLPLAAQPAFQSWLFIESITIPFSSLLYERCTLGYHILQQSAHTRLPSLTCIPVSLAKGGISLSSLLPSCPRTRLSSSTASPPLFPQLMPSQALQPIQEPRRPRRAISSPVHAPRLHPYHSSTPPPFLSHPRQASCHYPNDSVTVFHSQRYTISHFHTHT
jgi:hypothetical protein